MRDIRLLTVGSLFSGIGGIDLGLEWTGGFRTIWFVENNKYCQQVLAKHWPGVPIHGDIKEVDFTSLPRPDLLCGGFPCQPFSVAGKRKGTADNRWLWPEFYRAICEIKPRWVLVENVPGLLSIDSGRVFGGILRDLAESGYDAEWQVLSAAQFGAPHLRFRMFLVAYTVSAVSGGRTVFGSLGNGGWGTGEARAEGIQPNHWETCADYFKPAGPDVADAGCEGFLQSRLNEDVVEGDRQSAGILWHDLQGWEVEARENISDSYQSGLSQSRVGRKKREPDEREGAAINRSDWWSVEPDVGRVAYGIPSRVDRLKSLGNAVVPACAEFIGERILEVEKGGG